MALTPAHGIPEDVAARHRPAPARPRLLPTRQRRARWTPRLPAPRGTCSASRLGVRGINWPPLPSPGPHPPPPPPTSVPSASSSSPGFSPCQADPWPSALGAPLSGRRPRGAHLSPPSPALTLATDRRPSFQCGSGVALICGHLRRPDSPHTGTATRGPVELCPLLRVQLSHSRCCCSDAHFVRLSGLRGLELTPAVPWVRALNNSPQSQNQCEFLVRPPRGPCDEQPPPAPPTAFPCAPLR